MAAGRIRFLGTGNAFNQDGRGSPAILFENDRGGSFLVDVGPTTLSALHRFSLLSDRLERLFLTHLHGDHIAGWPFLLLQMVVRDRRTSPFEVYGPVGTRESLEGLADLCYREILTQRLFEIEYHELPVRKLQGLAAGPELRFDLFPMDHHLTSIGFRFELGPLRVGVSGDTAWCDNLVRLAETTDLLIVECSSIGREGLAHLCLDEIREGLDELGGARILLIHLCDEVARQLALDPIARVEAMHDGLCIELAGAPPSPVS